MVCTTTKSLKCFECGDLGHKRNNTDPHNKEKRGKGPVQVDRAAEVKGQSEVSKLDKNTVINEKPGCSSERTEDGFEKNLLVMISLALFLLLEKLRVSLMLLMLLMMLLKT